MALKASGGGAIGPETYRCSADVSDESVSETDHPGRQQPHCVDVSHAIESVSIMLLTTSWVQSLEHHIRVPHGVS